MNTRYAATIMMCALTCVLLLSDPATAQSTPEVRPVPVVPAPQATRAAPPVTTPEVRPAESATSSPTPTDTESATKPPATIEATPKPVKPVMPACTTLSCADINRDSKLDREEIAALDDPTRTLQSLDTDGNGSVDELEWARFEQINLPESQ